MLINIKHHKNRKGMTLIELIAAIAIAAIVGTMTATMFMFPMRLLNSGGDRSDVQFNLRMVSDIITNEVRLASSVEILPASATIPSTIANDDKYIFVENSTGNLVLRDKTGDHIQFRADTLSLTFVSDSPYKALTYDISGQQDTQSFALDSQVAALNLAASATVIDSSGADEGKIIKINNSLPSVGTTGLYFIMSSPFEATVNETFFRTLTAYNYSGTYSFSFVNGELPPGVGINAGGTLNGTPTAVGSYIFSLRLTDDTTSVVRTFLINIIPAAASDPAPVASDVSISGVFQKGETLTSSYVYTDLHSTPQPEGASIVTWYRMDDLIGSNKTVIQSISPTTVSTPTTYTLMNADVGKYIAIEVTPKTSDGRVGNPVMTSPILVNGNLAPIARNITISPESPRKRDTLIGNYEYFDQESDDEWGTTYQWFYSIAPESTKMLISGATGKTYTTSNQDANKYFYFQVTPRAATGEKVGTSVMSANVYVRNN